MFPETPLGHRCSLYSAGSDLHCSHRPSDCPPSAARGSKIVGFCVSVHSCTPRLPPGTLSPFSESPSGWSQARGLLQAPCVQRYRGRAEHRVTFFGHFQGCWLHPGQPVPRLDHLFSEDIFPVIQPKRALEQMKETFSLPVSELRQTLLLLPIREGSSVTCRGWDAPKSGTNGKYRTDMLR